MNPDDKDEPMGIAAFKDPMRSLMRLIPFCQPQTLKDGYKMGRGIIKIVAVTANVDVTIPHILGRVPTWVVPLDAGLVYVPKVRRVATAWTTVNVTVQFDTTCTVTCWIV